MRYRLAYGILLFVPYILFNGYIVSHMGIAGTLWTAFGLFLGWIVALTLVTPFFTALKLDPKEETDTPPQEEIQQ